MSAAPTDNASMPNKYSIPLLLALLAAGLAGNYFKYPIFLNIDFLFGSVFALLALQFLGLGRGILAGAIIAGYTYILWNHPYAIIIMTAEVAVVGWLMRRRKMGMVLACSLYWLLIGMPLVYLFYHGVMHVPYSNTYIIMTKQAVNGIANALVARLIFTAYALWTRSSLTSFRELFYNLLAFFVLFPVLIILAINSRNDFAETDKSIRTQLIQNNQHVTQRMETWILNRMTAILNLAEMAATRTPQQMQPFLEQAKKSDINFLRVGLLDREATITAYYPLLDEKGQENIGKNFADRPYIPDLIRTLKPMLTPLVMGRTGGPVPVVMLLVPVVIVGEYGGYVVGVPSLDQIREYLDMCMDKDVMFYTLVDKNGNVIMSSRTDQAIMTPFVRGKGTLTRLDNGISQWAPPLPPNVPISERWSNSTYIAESSLGKLSEWKLILEHPVAPFQKALFDRYTSQLIQLFLILLGALTLAEFLSRRTIDTLEKLRLITSGLPVRLATDGCKDFVWPESGILETNQLIANFREMADSLTEQFNVSRRINETLEQRVEERTRTLSIAHEKSMQENTARKQVEEALRFANLYNRSLIEASLDPLMSIALDGKITDTNKAAEIATGYSRQELIGTLFSSYFTQPARAQEGYQKAFNDTFVRDYALEMRHRNGSVLEVLYNASVYKNESGDVIGLFAAAHDITKRMAMEKALRASEEKYRALFEHAPVGIARIDARGHFLGVNMQFARVHGYGSPEEFMAQGQAFAEVLADPADWSRLVHLIESQEVVTGFDTRSRRKDGSLFFTSQAVSAERDQSGKLIPYEVYVEDIHERKELEALREDFQRIMHHDLKSPMSGVIGLSEMMAASETVTEENRQLLLAIRDSGRKMLRLIDSSLSLYKLETGQYQLDLISIDIVAELHLIEIELSAWIEGKGLSMVYRFNDRPLSPTDIIKVQGDRTLTAFMLSNLIKNAVEAAPRGSRLTISITLGSDVVFSIHNFGRVPREIEDRFFEKYVTSGKAHKGTGLGTYSAKLVAEAHKGSIAMATSEEKGTLLTVTLPQGLAA